MSRLLVLPAAVLLFALAVFSCSGDDPSVSASLCTAATNLPVGAKSSSCGDCHQQQLQSWHDSHHAQAEVILEPGSVTVRDVGPDGTLQDFPAVRSIGVDPLVQYIVELDGRWHVPQQARDSSDSTWFDVFADGRQPGEWGHWTGRGMNWDTMCATCHNTGFHRSWSAKEDRFTTTVTEHGVGCMACHGSGTERTAKAESCWSCHSRRSELGTPNPTGPFLDHYYPGLPDLSETWHVDGQIQDEDFEFTSFALSKMFVAGVTCIDCHDPHSAKLRTEGDALCMTCHSGGGRLPAPVIETTTHSGHLRETSAVTCIDCHMTTTVYMQRHARHDHGFHIPDPRLTLETGVPNACNKCHTDRTPQWSTEIVEARPTWTGNLATRRRARAMFAARQQQNDALLLLLEAIEQETQPTWRAAILNMLQAWSDHPQVRSLLTDAATSADALQRSMAWPTLELLEDPVRAVRLRAARWAGGALDLESPVGLDLLENLRHNRGQPAGAMQEAQFLIARGDPGPIAEVAIPLTEAVERWDASSPAPLHLRAVALDVLGRRSEALQLMKDCCARFPQDATSWYLLGLAASAEQDYLTCRTALETALQLQPDFPDAARNLKAILDFEKQR